MINPNHNGHKRRSRAQIEKNFSELFADLPSYPHQATISDEAAAERVVAQLRNYGPATFRLLKTAICNPFCEEATLARSVSMLVMRGVLYQDGAYPMHYGLVCNETPRLPGF